MEKGSTVLLIDDDSRNIFALTAVLKSKGYNVLSSASAHEGLEMLFNNIGIKVVLMDIMMPDMDGYEAIGAIRKNESTSSLPIIAVTANAMVGDREKCIEAGANDYVSKPIDIDVLIRKLQHY